MSGDEECIQVIEDSIVDLEPPTAPTGELDGDLPCAKRQRVHAGGRRKSEDWQHVTITESQTSDGSGKTVFTVVCKCGHKIGGYSQKPKVRIENSNDSIIQHCHVIM